MKRLSLIKLPFTIVLMIGLSSLLITENYGNGNTEPRCEPSNTKQYELESNDLMVSHRGREFLSYLMECALPNDTTVHFLVDEKRYEFKGAMGLAPEWLESALTESKQRWISACMLARINHFGLKVPISIRAEHGDFESLQLSAKERIEFSIFEGDFWGNLFLDNPVAFVQRGNRTLVEEEDSVLKKRVCTEIDESLSTGEKQVTRCGFILINDRSDSKTPAIRTRKYREYVSVYLKPENKKQE